MQPLFKERICVFQTLRPKAIFTGLALVAGIAASAPALATTFVPSQTIRAGTKIQCTLDEHLDSSKLGYGDQFKLKVVDTSQPALQGSEIIGWITDVRQPAGATKGRVGFFLTTIQLANGKQKTITAYVINRRVKQYNPTAQYQQRQQVSPMAGVPYGTVTPGPVAWQMRMGSGGPSTVKQPQSTSLGGYVYEEGSWPIVVNAGTPVTVELAENLTIP